MKNNLTKMMLTVLILSHAQPIYSMHDAPGDVIKKIFTTISHTQTSVGWLAQCLTFARVCTAWREYAQPEVLTFTKQSVDAKTELLYKALELNNNEAVITFLLKSGANMHAEVFIPAVGIRCFGNYCWETTSKQDSAWYKAVSLGNVATVACLIKHGARVNEIIEKNSFKQTALMVACQRNNLALVQVLLEHGAHAKLKDTPPYMRDAYGYAESPEIKKLLAQHVDIERRRRDMSGDFDDTTQPEEERFFYIKGMDENGELVLTEDPRESI